MKLSIRSVTAVDAVVVLIAAGLKQVAGSPIGMAGQTAGEARFAALHTKQTCA